MPRYFRLLAIFITCLALLAPLAAMAGKPKPARRTISVSGQAALDIAPDMVTITVGVITRADTAAKAADGNAQAMQKVVASLKAALGDKGEMRTVGYRVFPRYQWEPKARKNRFVGFEASNRVLVKSYDIKGAGGLLDAAVKSGANSVDGPEWGLKDPAKARIKAQTAALADAKAQAQALAQAAGMRLGGVLKIKSGPVGGGPPPARVFRAAAAEKNTPIEPGRIQMDAQVGCVYILEPAP